MYAKPAEDINSKSLRSETGSSPLNKQNTLPQNNQRVDSPKKQNFINDELDVSKVILEGLSETENGETELNTEFNTARPHNG